MHEKIGMIMNISDAISIIKGGGIVAFPTETVYGLGARADMTSAIDKVYTAKNRPKDNPLICHFTSSEEIQQYVLPLPYWVEQLIHHFSPGPVSFLLPLRDNSPLLAATGGRPHVICRIPNHLLALQLIRGVGVPIAAPSANTSGKMSGTDSAMIEYDLGNRIDGVLDGGASSIGLESAILDCTHDNSVAILRAGAIGVEELSFFFSSQNLPITITQTNTTEITPGTKYKHYSPETPIYAINNQQDIDPTRALITTQEIANTLTVEPAQVLVLGSITNISDIAARLYRVLFQLDQLRVQSAQLLLPDLGNSSLAQALYNRLGKIIDK